MVRRLGLTVTALLALSPTAAQAGRTVERIATLPNDSPVREFAGIVAWTERGDDGYRLLVREPGKAARVIPAGPQAARIVFDIGSDTRGAPQVVYERDGDLYAFSLARTTGERPIRNANTTDSRETLPTLWRGRLAFTRIAPSGTATVYTKTMTAPRGLPSRRVPGVPSRGGRTSRGAVEALELSGRHLAQVVRYVAVTDQVGHSETEVRLVDLRGGVRQVARMSTGEGGQSFIGPSFADGRLWWAVSCFGDPSGCRYGIHRADLEALDVERTREGAGLEGFAAGHDVVYVVDAVGTDEAGADLPGQEYTVEARTVDGWTAR